MIYGNDVYPGRVSNSNSTFKPTAMVHVDLDSGVADIETKMVNGDHYELATIVIRLHGHPLGTVNLSPIEGVLDRQRLITAIWSQMKTAINDHLRSDGIDPIDQLVDQLDTSPIIQPSHPVCWQGCPDDLEGPLVSIVVATKDRTAELSGCISTLLEQSYKNFEIIVVDNGPSSRDTELMIEAKFGTDSRVRYIHEPRAGTSRARNLGTTAAKGSIVAFTDDDVIVDNNWLRALVRSLTLNPQADCVTGLILPAELETPAQEWFEEYGGFNKGFSPKLRDRTRTSTDSLLHPYAAGTFGSGNNVAYRTAALLRLGAFDTRLGPGTPTKSGEDLDTYLALVMSGGTIAYEPSAVIWHFHRRDYEGLKTQLRNYGIGLSALFTKWALKNPRYAFDIVSRIPRGVWTVVSPKSSKNQNRTSSFPRELAIEEMKGMAMGPIAYLRTLIQPSLTNSK